MRRPPPSRRRRGRPLAVLVLVLALVGAGIADYRYGFVEDYYHRLTDGPDHPATTPAAVPPPAGLALPALTTPKPVATPVTPGPLDPAAVRRALAPILSDPVLGKHVLATVVALDGTPAYQLGRGTARPASTTKLLTTTAALAVLGPEHRFATRVLAGGAGRIVLVGGGDPFLERTPTPGRADITTLAGLTAKALLKQGRHRIRLGYDDTLFSGPTADIHWPADYISDAVVSRVTALWVDEGRPATGYGRVPDPSLEAADAFAGALTAAGVRVIGAPVSGRVAAGSAEITRVQSAPLRQIVERILLVSDNEGAEVLGHQVGVAVEGVGSFDDGVRGVLSTLGKLGVDTSGITLYDGSGLSRRDAVPPRLLVDVLRADLDPAHPALRGVITSLPVAAFTGSLTNRFFDAAPAGRGRVRAKTGTLTNVFALAGVATGVDGTPMLFALMADRIDPVHTDRAKEVLDDAAGALGACRCGARPQPPG